MLGTATKLKNTINIALTGAVSGNANFDGSGNVKITTTQANISVLTGSITTPAANSGTMNASTTLTYPTGFNKDNCMVISIMSSNAGLANPTYNTVGSTGYSLEEMKGNYGLQANLTATGVSVMVFKVNDAAETKKINIKIILMKIT